jgi:hypothetical protein
MLQERVSYSEYRTGVADGTLKLGIMNQSAFYKLLLKPYHTIIEGIFTMLNIFLIIAIPILCFVFHNWSLLFGFAGCLIAWLLHLICISGHKSATRIKTTKIVFGLLIIISVAIIYKLGIMSLASFVLVCGVLQFLFFYFTGNYLMEKAIARLATNEDDYHVALNNGIIKTFRRF